ncbi:7595_t:CDS:2, partial [Dentiscutata heterogama]
DRSKNEKKADIESELSSNSGTSSITTEWVSKLEKNGIVLGEVIVYELPLQAHEICICEISHLMIKQCLPVKRTGATIYSLGATRTRAKGFCKEPDGSFRPKKSAVDSPNGGDGLNAPWPNIVLELYYDGENQVPSRMKVWHYCVSGPYVQQKLKPKNKFEFGTHNAKGDPLNYQEGTCLIKIPLDCLYHDLEPSIQVPRHILTDPIILDFFYVRQAILESYSYKFGET